ncbi:unnamed protein product [Bursaphelenchus xylophilus]|uniref:(pine wood nematode) hypothetical protein n=1 Tax=Bursaphelenchus xylophilus TaxID=6326 RepID=A0A1I7RVX3_BURXY|nr:unnamed protein product [Bursaphelenchus xylophilus]CAG9094823.1 unnamed protein product [Bursaphelenchus xylophilus]
MALLCYTILIIVTCLTCASNTYPQSAQCQSEHKDWEERMSSDPHSPLIDCNMIDARFIECENVGAIVQRNNSKEGEYCPFFGQKNGVLHKVNITCRVLPCIECRGEREFKRQVPCVHYSGHFFLSTLLYSMFLGMLAVDRFCLGYSAIAVGKLMTLGGLGVWWVTDFFLLINGSLKPADDSEWQPWTPF